MSSRQLPGLGLNGFWDEGEPWKTGGDTNWLKLSAMTQLAVESASTALPSNPTDGVIYIVPASDATNKGKVAVRDSGAWVYFTPPEGCEAWVKNPGKRMRYTSAAWGDVIGGVSLNAVNVFTRNQSVFPQPLTSSAVIQIDASLSNNFGVTLGENATLADPSNMTGGMRLEIVVRQDATGGRTLAYGNKYKWVSGAAPVLSTAPYAVDIIRARYDSVTGFLFCALDKGFDGTPEASTLLPAISDNNATFNDEGVSTAGWAPTNATVDTSSSWLRLTKTSTPGTQAKITKAVTLTGTDKDFIIYGKVRVRSSGSSDAGAIWLYDGGSKVLAIWFNYNNVSGSVPNSVSVQGHDGALQTAVAATGLNLETTPLEFALQYDHKFLTLNCYFKQPDGTWDLKARVPSVWFSAPNIEMVSISGAPAGFWMEFDYLSVCKPNIVVIGDSIAEGKTLYSPNRSLGLSNYSSTWARYFTAYASLRNTVVVNKGVGSETSTTTLARISDATSLGARVVFLHASTNDQVNGVSAATRTSNTTSMVDAINASGAKAVLLNGMYGTSTLAGNPAHRDYMVNWWNSSKDAVGAYSTLDIMEPLLSSGYMDASKTQSDAIHPNPAGHALIGGYISAA